MIEQRIMPRPTRSNVTNA